MYPDFSYLFADWFGTAADNGWAMIKTFGFLLVCAISAAAMIFRSELRGRETLGLLQGRVVESSSTSTSWGDLIFYPFLFFVIGFKLIYLIGHFAQVRSQFMSWLLSTQGDTTAGWFLGCSALAYFLYKKYALDKEGPSITKTILPSDQVMTLTLIATISGVLGSQLFVIFESKESWQAFLRAPISRLMSGQGMAVYGGIITAIVIAYFYTRFVKIPFLQVLDSAAPAIMIGYCIGRLGCHFAGDVDWGIVNTMNVPSWWFFPDWLWAYDYPHTILTHLRESSGNELIPIPDCSGYETADGGRPRHCLKLARPVFPTPLYESAAALLLFFILRAISPRLRIPGLLFSVYCILSGIERYFIEQIRVNQVNDYFGWQASQAELIAILFILSGIGGLIYFSVRGSDPTRSSTAP